MPGSATYKWFQLEKVCRNRGFLNCKSKTVVLFEHAMNLIRNLVWSWSLFNEVSKWRWSLWYCTLWPNRRNDYQLGSPPFILIILTSCITQRLSDQPNPSVNNSEIEPGKKKQMKRTYIIGDAVQPDADFPNKLTVKVEVIILTFYCGFYWTKLAENLHTAIQLFTFGSSSRISLGNRFILCLE